MKIKLTLLTVLICSIQSFGQQLSYENQNVFKDINNNPSVVSTRSQIQAITSVRSKWINNNLPDYTATSSIQGYYKNGFGAGFKYYMDKSGSLYSTRHSLAFAKNIKIGSNFLSVGVEPLLASHRLRKNALVSDLNGALVTDYSFDHTFDLSLGTMYYSK